MKEFYKLVEIVSKLRSPEGCPWDKEQTLYSMKNHLIEEVYELVDALDKKDIDNIKEELGDVLLHVVMHSQIASEDNLFNISDVIDDESEKLIRRHPHVFSSEKLDTTDKVLKRWEEIKKSEKKDCSKNKSILDKVPVALPSLQKAQKLQNVAAKVGFDWNNINDVLDKLNEEILELKEAISSSNKDNISEELGDVLFVLANVARHSKIDADESLRKSNEKFINRFYYIEKTLKEKGKNIENSTLEEMESLWQEAKSKGI